MMDHYEKLSSRYAVKPLTEGDVPDIYAVCRGNPLYYQYMRVPLTPEGIREDLTALPGGKSLEDKTFVGFYESGRLVAFLDLIAGYPDQDTAYIGWFMVERSRQGAGVGTGIISEAAAFLKERGFRRIRLGYMQGNQQSGSFWAKNKFVPTGTESLQEFGAVVHMERALWDGEAGGCT